MTTEGLGPVSAKAVVGVITNRAKTHNTMEKIFFFIFISPTEIIWHIRLRCIIQGQWAGNQSHNHRE
jgi:hypothetical protein